MSRRLTREELRTVAEMHAEGKRGRAIADRLEMTMTELAAASKRTRLEGPRPVTGEHRRDADGAGLEKRRRAVDRERKAAERKKAKEAGAPPRKPVRRKSPPHWAGMSTALTRENLIAVGAAEVWPAGRLKHAEGAVEDGTVWTVEQRVAGLLLILNGGTAEDGARAATRIGPKRMTGRQLRHILKAVRSRAARNLVPPVYAKLAEATRRRDAEPAADRAAAKADRWIAAAEAEHQLGEAR